jgi:hypothetical protein
VTQELLNERELLARGRAHNITGSATSALQSLTVQFLERFDLDIVNLRTSATMRFMT